MKTKSMEFQERLINYNSSLEQGIRGVELAERTGGDTKEVMRLSMNFTIRSFREFLDEIEKCESFSKEVE